MEKMKPLVTQAWTFHFPCSGLSVPIHSSPLFAPVLSFSLGVGEVFAFDFCSVAFGPLQNFTPLVSFIVTSSFPSTIQRSGYVKTKYVLPCSSLLSLKDLMSIFNYFFWWLYSISQNGHGGWMHLIVSLLGSIHTVSDLLWLLPTWPTLYS